jgi:outer membrane protein
MRALTLLVLVLSTGLSLVAQTNHLAPSTRAMSLRECIDLALGRNLDLQIQHLTLDIAGYDLSGAWGVYSPVFTTRAQKNYLDQPGNVDPKKSGVDFPYELDDKSLSSGLSGRLPIGFSYDLSTSFSKEQALTDFSSSPSGLLFPGGIRDTNNSYANAALTMQQHLLKDFWIDKDRQQILLRRKDLKISQQALRFQLMKTVLAVELGYTDLIAAREDVRVQEQSLALREQLVRETKRRVEVGDLPPLDADQAQTQLENTLTALASARELLASSENLFKSLLTDDFAAWVDLEIQPVDPLLAMPPSVNRSESFLKAMSTRPDLIEARLAIEKSDVAIRFSKNQLFPNLDLVGQYGGLGIDPALGTAANRTYTFQNSEYFYGVVVSFPLANLTERNHYRASKAAKQIAELQLKKAEQEVMLQIADFVNRVQTRFVQIASTRQARVYAEGALAAEQKKLANGLSTSFFVLQLQETLTAARMAEVRAMAEYNKMLAQLAFAEGSSLDRHNLGFELR